MKKLIALILAAMMVFAAACAWAEEEAKPAPLYATVGEAIQANEDGRVFRGGVPEEYVSVVTEKDGKAYRHVAYYDEALKALEEEYLNLDYEAEDFFEKHEELGNKITEYQMTLPLSYSEEFTAAPLTEEEILSRVGKPLGELKEEGFEVGSSGTNLAEDGETTIIEYMMRYGVFDYNCVVDADMDKYLEIQENGGEDDLVVKSMKLEGITEQSADLRFHTDGTVEEPEDPFAAYNDFMLAIGELMGKLTSGEEVDVAALAEELKTKFPEYAEMIDQVLTVYNTLGAEGLAALTTGGTAE